MPINAHWRGLAGGETPDVPQLVHDTRADIKEAVGRLDGLLKLLASRFEFDSMLAAGCMTPIYDE